MPGPVYYDLGSTELRPIEEEDLEKLQEMVNHQEIRLFTSGDEPVSMKDEQNWFEKISEDDSNSRFTITTEGEVIGTIGCDIEPNEASEIGIFIHPDHHGNGHGSRAVKMILRHIFEEKNIHKAYARVMEHNEASKKLWESVGFTQEAKLEEHLWSDGSYRDAYIYSIWQDEFDSG